MGVLATKAISGGQISRDWECGTFDLMDESNPSHGWTEISRDCDSWPARRTLYPYASGMRTGGRTATATNLDPTVPFRHHFPASLDEIITELDFSGVNGGVLPTSPCNQMILKQNDSREIRCEFYTVDYSVSKIYLDASVQVPGADYYAWYFAPTGGSGGGGS